MLLYDYEERQFRHYEKLARKTENSLNERLSIPIYVEEELPEDTSEDEAETVEIQNIDEKFIEFINNPASLQRTANSYINDYKGKGAISEVVAFARFDNGEVAYFTKNYKAYVINDIEQLVLEKGTSELMPDDCLIFARSNNKARDIVDNFLEQMRTDGTLPDEIESAYKQSKYWKQVLRDYMDSKGVNARVIADTMKEHDHQISEITIRNWIDEDTHIIGPQEFASLKLVAEITNDAELLNNTEIIFQSCKEIRKVRMKILNLIAKAVTKHVVSEKEDVSDYMSRTVREHIHELSRIRRIETIVTVNQNVPNGLVNRPLNIDE